MYTTTSDCGMESGRSALGNIRAGRASAAAHRPPAVTPLPHDWALQARLAPIAALPATAPAEVAGTCIDFATCTVLPARVDRTPPRTVPQPQKHSRL